MYSDFEFISTLQYRIQNQKKTIEAFESGEKYVQLDKVYKDFVRFHNREILRFEKKLAKAHAETVMVRKYWSEVMDDLDKEHQKEIRVLQAEIERLRKYSFNVAKQRDTAKDKLHKRTVEYYEVAGKLEEAHELNQKLTAQIHKDFENSSIPSSMQVAHKKIPNSREKTDRKPGGQPKHIGHKRKDYSPSMSLEIPAPDKYAKNPAYKPTGKIIHKKKVVLHVSVEVIDYYTQEFRNIKTRQRVHAEFPEGLVNEVTYDGSVKAFAFLLGNECNVEHHIEPKTNIELFLLKRAV